MSSHTDFAATYEGALPTASTPLDALFEPTQQARASRRRRLRRAALGVAAVALFGGWLWHDALRRPRQGPDVEVPLVAGAKPQVAAAPQEAPPPERSPADAPGIAAERLSATDRHLADDEARLLRVYALLAAGEGSRAMDEARRLAADAPTFGLAQLLHADLLQAQSGDRAPGFVAAPAEVIEHGQARLRELTDEARARVAAAGSVPPAGAVPAQLVALGPSVTHAIAVDVHRSRVYVLAFEGGHASIVREYYASIGKEGFQKQQAGDQRTPLGVYFMTAQVPPQKLPQRYGDRALVLNYPNPYDRLFGRNGDGIWLHGVPEPQHTRAPLATDGCVALANPDIRELLRYVDRQATPIVIAERIDWVPPDRAAAGHEAFFTAFEAWQVARRQDGAEAALQRFYAPAAEAAAAFAAASAIETEQGGAAVRAETLPRGAAAPSLDTLSVLHWSGSEPLMIVTLARAGTNGQPAQKWRQYWFRRGGEWRIFFESALA